MVVNVHIRHTVTAQLTATDGKGMAQLSQEKLNLHLLLLMKQGISIV
jgi:hypothetical protein